MVNYEKAAVLTVTREFLGFTRDLVDLMPADKPMLIETLARFSGDTIPFTRKMMWVAKSRGWVTASSRNGRVYYTKVKP